MNKKCKESTEYKVESTECKTEKTEHEVQSKK
jgi:hypothetical protein